MSLLFQKLLSYTLFKCPEKNKNGGIYDGMQRFAAQYIDIDRKTENIKIC